MEQRLRRAAKVSEPHGNGRASRVVVIGLAACLLVAPLRANVGISPAYVEVRLDQGRPAGRFLVSNLGDKTERFRINAVHFTYTPTGGINQSSTGKHSLAPWIHFNPRELTIAPKTKRAVRFAIVPRGPLVEGEYWAAMELESLKTAVASAEEKSGRTMKLKMVATVMVPIFGTVGDVRYEGTVEKIKLGSTEGDTWLRAVLVNSGNGRLGAQGSYEIFNAAGESVERGTMGRSYVLRGASRIFAGKLKTELEEGTYTIKISYVAQNLEKPIERTTSVYWKPPPPVAEKPPPTVETGAEGGSEGEPGAATQPSAPGEPMSRPAG
jgi:hypothetical protein